MTERRGALAGLAAGVLLLLLLVGFAVVLPRIDAAPETTSDGVAADATGGDLEPVELPDELPGGLVAQDSGQLPVPEGADEAEFQGQLEDFQNGAVASYEDLYSVGAAFRLYASADGAQQALVTVLDEPPGLFAPDGPPVDPELAGVARPSTDLVAEGDAICAINWGQPVPAGQPVPEGAPLLARCQLGAGGRTWEMAASGLSTADVVATLDDLAAQA